MAARTDVHHALLVARFDIGDAHTAAVVMGAERDGGAIVSWWAGVRGYAMTPEGVATLTDPWQRVRGEGTPPEPFSVFTTAAAGAKAWPLLPARLPAPASSACSAVVSAVGRPDGVAMARRAACVPVSVHHGVERAAGEGAHEGRAALSKWRRQRKISHGDGVPPGHDMSEIPGNASRQVCI